MDSVTALYDAASRGVVAAALSFDYGAKHHDRELPLAKWHADRLGVRHLVVPLPFLAEHFDSALLKSGGEIPKGHYEEESMKQTVVPFRNGILLSIAAGFAESCGANGLVIAAHAGDHAIYPDCREEFMQSMGEAIRLGTYAEVALLASVYSRWIKVELWRVARRWAWIFPGPGRVMWGRIATVVNAGLVWSGGRRFCRLARRTRPSTSARVRCRRSLGFSYMRISESLFGTGSRGS